ncbi:MAG: hypothetical protein AB7O78_06760 [Thermoleophilia bacterium]
MSDEGSPSATLDDLAALALSAADAKGVEREAVQRRDAAVVAAVRAGARLDEIALAAGVTKAAVSAIARKTLAPRSARGGPYRRRRGVEAALAVIRDASEVAAAATQDRRLAVRERDVAIVFAADEGLAIGSIARAVGMEAKVLHNLIRRRRAEATQKPDGTVASLLANEETPGTID